MGKGVDRMNILYRLRCAAARLMYGRNGTDQLYWALLIAGFVLDVVGGFPSVFALRSLLRMAGMLLLALAFYRAFSRDVAKRRAENAKFLYWCGPRCAALRDWRYRHADKAHKYVKCACGAWCRVPRGVGKIELKCPKCGENKIVKT